MIRTASASSWRSARTVALVVGAGLVLSLAVGCTYKPLVSGELEGLADDLVELPGVADIRLYISDSPFSDESTVTVDLAPDFDRADLDAVRDATCTADLRNEPGITLRYEFAGGAVLLQGPMSRCWTQPLLFVEALPAFADHADDFRTVNWGEYADGGAKADFDIRLGDMTEDRELSTDGVGAQAALLGDVLAALRDDGTAISGSIDGIAFSETTLVRARAAVAVIVDLTARYPVWSASAGDVAEVTLVSTGPAIVAEATAYLATTYPDFPVAVDSAKPE